MKGKAFTEGVYSGLILDHYLGKASTGTPQFVMNFKVVGRFDDNGQLEPCAPAERIFRHPIGNEASVQRLSLELRRVIRIENLNQLAHQGPGGSSLVGKTIGLTCHLESLDGRPVERWGILRNDPLPAEEVQSLQARFGDVLQKMNARFAPPANGSSEPSSGNPDSPAAVDATASDRVAASTAS